MLPNRDSNSTPPAHASTLSRLISLPLCILQVPLVIIVPRPVLLLGALLLVLLDGVALGQLFELVSVLLLNLGAFLDKVTELVEEADTVTYILDYSWNVVLPAV